MRIQNNIAALNSYRQLNTNNNAISKNLEKLSSGYRINRAGDDAAGLAISEKMRAQIVGLETAQKNANDGISLVQTAEGALTEVHSMLNRMVELATQSANGTYNTTDRNKIQAEVDALVSEIDRIAESTNFNGTTLLDGNLAADATDATAATASITPKAATPATNTTIEIDLKDLTLSGGGTLAADSNLEITIGSAKLTSKAGDASSTSAADLAKLFEDQTVQIGNETYTASVEDTKVILKSTNTGPLSSGDKVTDGSSVSLAITGTNASSTTITAGDTVSNVKVVDGTNEIKDDTTTGSAATFEVDLSGVSVGSGQAANDEYTLTIKTAGGDVTVVGKDTAGTAASGSDVAKLFAGKTVEIDGVEFGITESSGKLTFTAKENASVSGITANTTQVTLTATSGSPVISGNTGLKVGDFTDGAPDDDGNETTPTGGIKLQIGDTGDSFNQLTVNIDSMKAADLFKAEADANEPAGAATTRVVDISDATKANEAIKKINDAIDKVSTTRGDLGAIQNRLEHTINNLGVTTENITAAESRIRDTDMAEEMMAYTKNNILVQASQAMLAQANTIPQGVLQLLQ